MRHLALVLTALTLLTAVPSSADVVAQSTHDGQSVRAAAPFLVDRSDVPTAHHGQFAVRYRVARLGVGRTASAEFRRTADAILGDKRGWNGDGAVAFRWDAENPDFTLWLASPAAIAATGVGCSKYYSCRIGDDVYINAMRWQRGTDSYDGLPLRAYRTYVVNHEVGHWLGLSHRGCPQAGTPSPVMQQQSKKLRGCEPRPWPLPGEVRTALAELGRR